MNPVQAFNATYNGVGGGTQSQWVTFSFAITQEFEAFVMYQVATPATYSAPAEMYTWRSTSGGVGTWETNGTFKGVFPITASFVHRKTINLETGQYLVGIMVGDSRANDVTVSVAALTAYVITAYV